MADVVALPVQVAGLDDVKIDQTQMTHPDSCKHDCNIGTQSPQPGDGHTTLFQLFDVFPGVCLAIIMLSSSSCPGMMPLRTIVKVSISDKGQSLSI